MQIVYLIKDPNQRKRKPMEWQTAEDNWEDPSIRIIETLSHDASYRAKATKLFINVGWGFYGLMAHCTLPVADECIRVVYPRGKYVSSDLKRRLSSGRTQRLRLFCSWRSRDYKITVFNVVGEPRRKASRREPRVSLDPLSGPRRFATRHPDLVVNWMTLSRTIKSSYHHRQRAPLDEEREILPAAFPVIPAKSLIPIIYWTPLYWIKFKG